MSLLISGAKIFIYYFAGFRRKKISCRYVVFQEEQDGQHYCFRLVLFFILSDWIWLNFPELIVYIRKSRYSFQTQHKIIPTATTKNFSCVSPSKRRTFHYNTSGCMHILCLLHRRCMYIVYNTNIIRNMYIYVLTLYIFL